MLHEATAGDDGGAARCTVITREHGDKQASPCCGGTPGPRGFLETIALQDSVPLSEQIPKQLKELISAAMLDCRGFQIACALFPNCSIECGSPLWATYGPVAQSSSCNIVDIVQVRIMQLISSTCSQ